MQYLLHVRWSRTSVLFVDFIWKGYKQGFVGVLSHDQRDLTELWSNVMDKKKKMGELPSAPGVLESGVPV